MKLTQSIRVAMWLLKHGVGEPYGDAIAGDLLEAMQASRSARWFWQQTLSALLWMSVARVRTNAVFLLFCLLWGGLYPGWWLLAKWILTQSTIDSVISDVPYGTSLEVLTQFLPAASFLCVGFAICVFHQRTHIHSVSKRCLAYGVSFGLNVFLVTIAGYLAFMQGPVLHFRQGITIVFSQTHLAAMSLLLALCLFAATRTALAGQLRAKRLLPF